VNPHCSRTLYLCFALLLSACTSLAPSPTVTVTPTETPLPPYTPTQAPTPTPTQTLTPTVTSAPTPQWETVEDYYGRGSAKIRPAECKLEGMTKEEAMNVILPPMKIYSGNPSQDVALDFKLFLNFILLDCQAFEIQFADGRHTYKVDLEFAYNNSGQKSTIKVPIMDLYGLNMLRRDGTWTETTFTPGTFPFQRGEIIDIEFFTMKPAFFSWSAKEWDEQSDPLRNMSIIGFIGNEFEMKDFRAEIFKPGDHIFDPTQVHISQLVAH
jgi:hypothetical protein